MQINWQDIEDRRQKRSWQDKIWRQDFDFSFEKLAFIWCAFNTPNNSRTFKVDFRLMSKQTHLNQVLCEQILIQNFDVVEFNINTGVIKWIFDLPNAPIKTCKSVYLRPTATNREKQLKLATVPCSNLTKIKEIYKQAKKLSKETGIEYHVDHIAPLQGELICGLHVEWNLEIIPATENLKKSNKFEVIG